jgi:hypothetical protein
MGLMDKINFQKYTKRKFPYMAKSVTLYGDGYNKIVAGKDCISHIVIHWIDGRFIAEVVYERDPAGYIRSRFCLDVAEFS